MDLGFVNGWLGAQSRTSTTIIGIANTLSEKQFNAMNKPSNGKSRLRYLPLILCLTASAAQLPDGDFAGVGVQLRAEGQNIVVNRILPDTPAAAQKDLHVGDRIVAVAQGQERAVQVQNIMQAARSIRGPKGTMVRLTIIPAGEDDSHVRVLSFVRGEVKLPWGDGLLLATGTKAPDIEMVEVANKAGERLSNYAGKIIILEFWSTWCGPCQTKMAKLQSYPGEYPGLEDQRGVNRCQHRR